METAILKFSRFEIGDDLVFNPASDPSKVMGGDYLNGLLKWGIQTDAIEINEQVVIGQFNLTQFVELLSAERLCAEFVKVGAYLRRANKGGLLRVETHLDYRVENDEITECLIRSYDLRKEEITTVATTSGIPLKDGSVDSPKGIGFLPRYNYEQVGWPESNSQRFYGESKIISNLMS